MDCELTGKSSAKTKEKDSESTKEIAKENVIHLDSYEYFRCCINDETVSSVIMVPDSVIRRRDLGNLDTKPELDGVRSRNVFAFLVGTTEGRIRLFVSVSPPEKIK